MGNTFFKIPADKTERSKNELLQNMIDTTELEICGRQVISLLGSWDIRLRRYEETSDGTKDSELIQIVAAGMLSDIGALLKDIRSHIEYLHDVNIDGPEYPEPKEDEFVAESQLLDYLDILKLPEPLSQIYSSLVWAGKKGEMTGPLRGANTGSGRKRKWDGLGLISVQVKTVVAIDLLIFDHNFSEKKAADKVANVLSNGGFSTSDKRLERKLKGIL